MSPRMKKRRPGRPRCTWTGAKVDVLELRRSLGRLQGRQNVSRAVLAKLLGANPGSIVKWEGGSVPRDKFQVKLRELAQRAASGNIDVPVTHRGRKPRLGRNGATPMAAPRGSSASISGTSKSNSRSKIREPIRSPG